MTCQKTLYIQQCITTIFLISGMSSLCGKIFENRPFYGACATPVVRLPCVRRVPGFIRASTYHIQQYLIFLVPRGNLAACGRAESTRGVNSRRVQYDIMRQCRWTYSTWPLYPGRRVKVQCGGYFVKGRSHSSAGGGYEIMTAPDSCAAA